MCRLLQYKPQTEKPTVIKRDDSITDTSNRTFTGLLPYTWYTLLVKTVRKRDDNLPARAEERVRTGEYQPSAPRPQMWKSTDLIMRRECYALWTRPVNPNGILTHYQLRVTGSVRVPSEDSITSEHHPNSPPDPNDPTACGDHRHILPHEVSY